MRDWHAWHEEYADPASSLSRRLEVVRGLLGDEIARGTGPLRLLSLCSGDGRDTIPVVRASERPVSTCLVELDEQLAQTAREVDPGADVRTGDAGDPALWRDVLPVDVLMLCGIFGNVPAEDVDRTVRAARAMVRAGGLVIWTRAGDEADRVRRLFDDGWDEVAWVRPEDADFRVGAARLTEPSDEPLPARLFSFVG